MRGGGGVWGGEMKTERKKNRVMGKEREREFKKYRALSMKFWALLIAQSM